MRIPGTLISYIALLSLPSVFEAVGFIRLTPILTYAYIMSIYALSFSIPLRYLGLLNFGHALFFGFGAYITTYQLTWTAAPYPISILVALLAGLLLGICIALVSRKAFRGIPFAFLTLTVLLIVYFLYRRRELRAISGSEQGLSILPPEILKSEAVPLLSIIVFAILIAIYFRRLSRSDVPRMVQSSTAMHRGSSQLVVGLILAITYSLVIATLMEIVLSRPGPYRVTINLYVASLIALYLSYTLLESVSRSQVALSWTITRDNEIRAETMGYDTFTLKAIALTLSGALASAAGSLYVVYSLGVNPERAFNPLLSVYGLIYCVVGGIYTLEGPIAGAILVTLMENYLADYLGGWSQVFTGLLFIAIMLFLPGGVSYYPRAIMRRGIARVQRIMGREETG